MKKDISSIGARMLRKMSELNISQEALANEVGISQNSISKIITGKTQRSRYMPAIAKTLNVSEQWLLFGDSSNAEIAGNTKQWDSSTTQPENMVAIPFYEEVKLSAGDGSCILQEDDEGRTLWFPREFFKKKCTSPDKVICLTITGDSMEPHFKEGGVVTVDCNSTDIIDGKIYAINYLNELYFKKVSKLSPTQLLLSSENPTYPAIKADAQDITIIGRIINYNKEL